LALGSVGVVVVLVSDDDVDVPLPPSAAAIAASSAASFGSTGVSDVSSAEVAGLAGAGSDDASADAFLAVLADEPPDDALPVVPFFAVFDVSLLPVAVGGGDEEEAVDGVGEDEDDADGGVDGAGACEGCDGCAGGAGGGLGGAAASISSENGVAGAPPWAGGVGGENVECGFDGGGGADGDATADTKLTSIKNWRQSACNRRASRLPGKSIVFAGGCKRAPEVPAALRASPSGPTGKICRPAMGSGALRPRRRFL